MNEIWYPIEEFPIYRVSNYGRVVNYNTGRILNQSTTGNGLMKISLVHDNVRYTRGVALLVAEAFVDGQTEVFNTPIHLDGNHENNHADNILWRPRWFAWKYTYQCRNISVHHNRGPIYDIDSGEVYETFFDAARTHGILVRDIWSSIMAKNPEKPTFPTRQIFAFLK